VADRNRIVAVAGLTAQASQATPKHSLRALARRNTPNAHIAHVKIAEGCDNNCTYCTIPRIRGGYTSVPEQEIIDECRALLASGVSEIVLVAQDSALYGADIYGEVRLAELLVKLNALCAEFAKKSTPDDVTQPAP
jgi:tRNA A37 methylthiotransferase MiaB